ncbi:MAG: hemolysin family protein, partial [Oscillospiraceae bacterium]
ILKPVTWLFMQLKRLAGKLIKSSDDHPSVTEDELKYIIDEIEDEGVLEEQESDLVRSALEFDEITISEVLVPRVSVIAVSRDESLEKIKDIFIQTKFSRLPVYEKTIDSIVGIIHQSDFYELYLSGGGDISTIMNTPVYVSENKRISEGLHEMQKAKVHMAVVVDQYGGTEGICTLEDIIEELVGEIYDESDEEDTSFVKLGENRYQVSSELSVSDFLDRLELPEDTIETERTSMGGWIMDLLDRIPEQNEFISYGPFNMTVVMEDEQKIDSIKIRIRKEEKEESKNA